MKKPLLIGLLSGWCLVGCIAAVQAQLSGSNPVAPTGGTRAIALPLSGRMPGETGVELEQSGVGATPNSINTLNTNLKLNGDYRGAIKTPLPADRPKLFKGHLFNRHPSFPSGSAAPDSKVAGTAVDLSLKQAIQRGLTYNLGAIDAAQSVLQAHGQRLVYLSSLLPNLSASAQFTETQINSAQIGIKVPGIRPVIGPYHYFTAQGNLSQTLFDATAFKNFQAALTLEQAAKLSTRDARELVVYAVSGAYLQVINAQARLQATQVQVETAKALYQQSMDRYKTGLNAKIDPLRAKVEFQTQEQRVVSLENDMAKRLLELCRAIGLPMDQAVRLTDTLPYIPLQNVSLASALANAQANRWDLKAARKRVEAAKQALAAARAEYLPSASVTGSLGWVGRSLGTGSMVFAASPQVRMPIFEGTHIQGEVMQAKAALRQREAEWQDSIAQAEYEVRSAILDLQASAQQVHVAESNIRLAKEALNQARDRFLAGVADTVEVVQAQETMANANEDYIASVYTHNLSKVSLARATGLAEQVVPEYLLSAGPRP